MEYAPDRQIGALIGPTEVVIETVDVVLPEVLAMLNFDEDKIGRA